MTLARRQFGQALIAAGTGLAAASVLAQGGGGPALFPKRLQPGDTIGLVSPANATYEREPIAIATEALQALGFKVRESPHLRARYGQFGGTGAQRADSINAMFADDSVAGLIAMTGGSGCNRIVDKLDCRPIQAKPKFFGGFSDLTSLLNAILHRTGLVTFHARWPARSGTSSAWPTSRPWRSSPVTRSCLARTNSSTRRLRCSSNNS